MLRLWKSLSKLTELRDFVWESAVMWGDSLICPVADCCFSCNSTVMGCNILVSSVRDWEQHRCVQQGSCFYCERLRTAPLWGGRISFSQFLLRENIRSCDATILFLLSKASYGQYSVVGLYWSTISFSFWRLHCEERSIVRRQQSCFFCERFHMYSSVSLVVNRSQDKRNCFHRRKTML